MSKPDCTMCDDTGFKDHAWLRTEPCDHLQPTPAADEVEAGEAKRLVQIIEGAGHDWSVNLTRLVDGVSEYTLTYHGEVSIHPSTEEAYARLRKLREDEKSAAVLEYVQIVRAKALEEAANVADEEVARSINSALPGWTVTHARRDEAQRIAKAIRALQIEEPE